MEISTSQPTVSGFDNNLLDRMVRAVEKVRERLRRATLALDAAKLPYAVVGGNAVAAWVSQVDPGAARNTADIDLLVNRCDFDRIKQSLTEVGFVYRELMGVPMFLDGETGSPRDAVHLLFAGEKVQQDYETPSPPLTLNAQHTDYRLLELEPLVVMKLTSYRLKDRVHLLDLIEVGLVDPSWCKKLPSHLATRLQTLLDNPDA